ncbi:MAG TPA: ATP-binding protein [Caulobacteraceae bacterium]|nr:ATP-binding protein [Caulobacteraceae bacterium]
MAALRPFWRFNRLAPTSLFRRSLLIIVLPIAVMQIAVALVFFEADWRGENDRLSAGFAGEVALLSSQYRADPSPADLQRLQAEGRVMGLSLTFQPGASLPTHRRPHLFRAADWSLKSALLKRLAQPFWFDTEAVPGAVDVRVQTGGGVLRFVAPTERVLATRAHIFVLWLSGATVLLTAVALLFIRNQIRAIERLATAAEAYGRGVETPFRPHGAREVRQAAKAFLAMKARIQRHVEQRTALLAAVSHDLRTPLTRLKLELALARPSPRTAAMKRDVADMEAMIDEYLAFARGEAAETVEKVDVESLIDEVRRGAERSGAQITAAAEPRLVAEVKPNAIKRALSNLVMNAVAHADRVQVIARSRRAGGVEIVVDDDGPGIPEDRVDEALTPFGRLDPARNQNEKGVGLGLAIARDVARGHGGEITLGPSPLGGLRVTLRLPG